MPLGQTHAYPDNYFGSFELLIICIEEKKKREKENHTLLEFEEEEEETRLLLMGLSFSCLLVKEIMLLPPS